MRDIWGFLLQTLTASGVAVLLLAVKALLRDKLSPRWQFAAWGVLAAAVLVPAGWNGGYALLNWPFFVETAKSILTGAYTVTRVTAPVPLLLGHVPVTVWDWLFLVYAAGVVLTLGRYLLSYLRLRLALRRGSPVPEAQRAQVEAVAKQYGLPTCRCVAVKGFPSAFVCGVFFPVLALPEGEETDHKVLLHELLHLKYRDTAWGMVIALLRSLHWCNPLLQYCAGRAANDLEERCDQRSLELLEGEERRDYGRILLGMANDRCARTPGATTMANGGKNIAQRVEAIARFKKYPAGMGLVSVCVLLLLVSPVALGAKAEGFWEGGRFADKAWEVDAALASARLTPCTTYAGAFDAYAKAVLEQNGVYRAICTPLEDYAALAATLKEHTDPPDSWPWPEPHWDPGLPGTVRQNADWYDSGYLYYGVTPVGEEAYEGVLALDLIYPPDYGLEWDGTFIHSWKVLQTVRCEKRGDRWVALPQEDFRLVQGDETVYGNLTMPAREYRAVWGDYTVVVALQTTSIMENSYGTDSTWGMTIFNHVPVPDGKFAVEERNAVKVIYAGAPWPDGGPAVGVSMTAWDGQGPRPVCLALEERQFFAESRGDGSSSGAHGDKEWPAGENELLLSGGGSYRDADYTWPAAYAADFYLNGEKVAELTLLPQEGGGAE